MIELACSKTRRAAAFTCLLSVDTFLAAGPGALCFSFLRLRGLCVCGYGCGALCFFAAGVRARIFVAVGAGRLYVDAEAPGGSQAENCPPLFLQ